jgi:hypothetical protein
MPAPSILQTSPSGTASVSFGSTPATTSWIVCLFCGHPTASAVTDNQATGGNSYIQKCVADDPTNGNGAAIWVAQGPLKSSGTFTISWTGSAWLRAYEIGNVSLIDGTPGATINNSSASTGASTSMGTLTNALDLLMCCIQPNGGQSITAGTSWTTLVQENGGFFYSEDQITSSALGSYNATGTLSSADLWCIAAIALGASSSAAWFPPGSALIG